MQRPQCGGAPLRIRQGHSQTAADVDTALARMAAGYSTAAVRMGHLALMRAIRHAQARRYVTLNAAELTATRPHSPADSCGACRAGGQ